MESQGTVPEGWGGPLLHGTGRQAPAHTRKLDGVLVKDGCDEAG